MFANKRSDFHRYTKPIQTGFDKIRVIYASGKPPKASVVNKHLDGLRFLLLEAKNLSFSAKCIAYNVMADRLDALVADIENLIIRLEESVLPAVMSDKLHRSDIAILATELARLFPNNKPTTSAQSVNGVVSVSLSLRGLMTVHGFPRAWYIVWVSGASMSSSLTSTPPGEEEWLTFIPGRPASIASALHSLLKQDLIRVKINGNLAA